MRAQPRSYASRRSVLAALGSSAAVFSSGCLQRARSLTGWQSAQPVQLQIKTLPDDADPYALSLARRIAQWFREAGVSADVLPMAEQELLRQSLLRTDFDLFVMRLPSRFRDPDALTTLLHSRYADAPGWQNPFGYTNLEVDEALERQRRTSGGERWNALSRIQRTIATTQPFTLLTFPDDIRAAHTTSHSDWQAADLRSPLGFLQLEGDDTSEEPRLRVVGTDRRATTNLNPLSVEFRRDGVLMGLLYDPVARPIEGELTPWLAESVEFSNDGRPTARVTLREDVTWHDDKRLTADDVAFTYELLADTTLSDDDEDSDVPSPEFRSRSTLVSDVTVVDDRRVDVQFVEADVDVVPRALQIPILPEHVWGDRTDSAAIGGIPLGTVTEALVTNNIPPVGSGPFEYAQNSPRERLLLERTDDHFSTREGTDLPDWLENPPFDELSVQVVGSDVTAVETVADGGADVTGTTVGASTVPRIGRAEGTELLVRRSDRPYILGFNTRRSHLDNPQFRHTLARLVDERALGDDVLDGYAHTAVGPLHETEWYPEDLEWETENPVVPFLGEDGDLNSEAAREAFREAGYQYQEGTLVARNA